MVVKTMTADEGGELFAHEIAMFGHLSHHPNIVRMLVFARALSLSPHRRMPRYSCMYMYMYRYWYRHRFNCSHVTPQTHVGFDCTKS